MIRITKNIYVEKGAKNGTLKGNFETGLLIEAQAKLLCPVDFGQLRNSIMTTSREAESGFNESGGLQAEPRERVNHPIRKEMEVIVGTNSDHWYPEFGTRNQIAQPFLRPAKEIVVNGTSKDRLAAKFGREEMEKSFKNRKKKVIKSG